MRREIPARARFELCRTRARSYLQKMGVDWLPVDPFALYRADVSWELMPYSEARRVFGGRDPLGIRRLAADARTVRASPEGCYLTVYDESRRRERIRFTLAHEIGHIVLGHLTDFNETSLARSNLTDEKHRVLEREADTFASELLTPLPLLKLLGISNPEDIAMLCDVSRSAAENRIRDLTWLRHIGYCKRFADFYEAQFAQYTEPIAVCRAARNLPPLGFQMARPEVHEMPTQVKKHLFIPTRGDGRFEFCPQCGNTVFSEKAQYCRMCGFYLYNECSNQPTSGFWADDCGRRFAGDARYCEDCGAPTTLFRRGVLLAWDEIVDGGGNAAHGVDPDDRRLYEKEAAASADNGNADDDDIPF